MLPSADSRLSARGGHSDLAPLMSAFHPNSPLDFKGIVTAGALELGKEVSFLDLKLGLEERAQTPRHRMGAQAT